MTLRNISFIVSLIISTICLAAGYVIADQWIGTAVAIVTGAVWLAARKFPATYQNACLLLPVSLALAGLLIGVNPMMMIAGSSFALAAWDLLLLDGALKGTSSGEQTNRYEKKHLQSLAIALGCGFVLAMLGRLLTFNIPFIVMLLLAAILIFGFERIGNELKEEYSQLHVMEYAPRGLDGFGKRFSKNNILASKYRMRLKVLGKFFVQSCLDNLLKD